ncbi:MAG: type IV pilus biogenesis protein PilM [Anaerolineae bacterium]
MQLPWLRAERFTLHIEPDEIRGMVAYGKTPQRWASISLPEDVFRNDAVVHPQALSAALEALKEKLNLHTPEVHFSLHHRRAILRRLQLPNMPDKVLEEAVRREARREFPLPPEEVYLSWQKVSGGAGGQQEIFTVGIPRNAVDDLVAALQKAGLKPLSLDLKYLALVRALRQPNVILVDMEPTDVRLILIHDFLPCIVRTVSLPTHASPDEAATHLMSEVQRVIDYCRSHQRTDATPHEPRLCPLGPHPQREELAEFLGRRWKVIPPKPPLSLPEEFPLHLYLTNLGLMLKEVKT